MTQNIRWFVGSIVMLLFSFGVAYSEYVIVASNIAEEVAPSIGVDEDLLRDHLTDFLSRHWVNRAIFYCAPWLLLSFYFLRRMISDNKSREHIDTAK